MRSWNIMYLFILFIYLCMHAFIHSFIHSFCSLVLRQVRSILQNEFSGEWDLVLPFQFPVPTHSLPCGHPVAIYVFFTVFSSLLPCVFPSVRCFRRQFLRKMWTVKLAFLRFIVCGIFLSTLTVCSLLTRSVQLIFSVLLQHHISKLSRCFRTTSGMTVGASYDYLRYYWGLCTLMTFKAFCDVFRVFLSAGLSSEQPYCAHEKNMLWERLWWT